MIIVVAVMVFWPVPVDRPFRQVIMQVLDAARDRGLPPWVTYNQVERAANVLLFMPVGAVVTLVLRRPVVALTLCVLASAGIELVQYFLLGSRKGSVVDLAMNSLGAAVGVTGVVVTARIVRLLRNRWGRRSVSEPS
ncbi:hypothetical protein BKD30_10895 [Tersicoccus phoenicis]|uniref:VanZ-like domain-containing protein n=1 Tax=Tersicoccus phoenicis TaxID=554083 RepID=A0A1R1L8K7_9MICC|nr:hypothetical protein BKD30_10895 [Tersicoccus phoenicis]